MIGKVRWFDYQKGYGFIESNNKDIYVHGLKAHNVHIIKEEIDV